MRYNSCQTGGKNRNLQLLNSRCWLPKNRDKQPNRKKKRLGLGKPDPCPTNSVKWRLGKCSIHEKPAKWICLLNFTKTCIMIRQGYLMIFDSLQIQDSQQLFPGFFLTLWCLPMVWGLQWTFPGDMSETVYWCLIATGSSKETCLFMLIFWL